MPWACVAGKPVFATTAYEPDARGVLRPVLPERCVFASGAEACSLRIDHYRPRKTGPCFPLAVVGCSTHGAGRYTLYPPGHYRYGREAVVLCSPSGPLLRDEAGQPVWQETLFAAAADASRGERWPSDSPWEDARRRRTQGRRLTLAARLVGVHPTVADHERERIAARLGVPVLVLRTAAQSWTASWRLHGAVVVAVLLALAIDASLLDRVLAAGSVAGVWPAPLRWDPVRRSWLPPRSEASKRSSVLHPRGRSPPPTNLPAVGAHGPH